MNKEWKIFDLVINTASEAIHISSFIVWKA